MAKDRDASEKREKKDKKKHKHSEENGVSKSKQKKDKAVVETAQVDADGDVIINQVEVTENKRDAEEGTEGLQIRIRKEREGLVGAMVPFANPLADDKILRRVLRNVKRSAKHKALKRGVKEVVKALRKSPIPITAPATSGEAPPAVVVLAADISPFDVISHIPVLCEDHSVPYIYVPSRAELGAASSTKRPTSVVMMLPKPGRRKAAAGEKEEKEEEQENWEEIFADTAKMVEKAGRSVKV